MLVSNYDNSLRSNFILYSYTEELECFMKARTGELHVMIGVHVDEFIGTCNEKYVKKKVKLRQKISFLKE